MSTLKTLPTELDPIEFLNKIPDEVKRADSLLLVKLFEKMTGKKARMWGSSIVGFGMYHYKSERSSQEGDWPLVGFSPRKLNLTLYVMHGADTFKELFTELGKYKVSSGSCLYIKKLSDVNIELLEKIIAKSFKYASEKLL